MLSTKKLYWLVAHPLSQHKEDVKELARINKLEIVDLRFKGTLADSFIIQADKAPKLTSKAVVKKPN